VVSNLERTLTEAGFRVAEVLDFNRFSAPGWWLNGKLLRRKNFLACNLR
jgi:hypothetical protein